MKFSRFCVAIFLESEAIRDPLSPLQSTASFRGCHLFLRTLIEQSVLSEALLPLTDCFD